ncbi:MAG TPA: LptF/LptG family permease [Pyrinomonadaceae bacterium]|nr:LptF/LptG family permease [Chloracidobacterium sp.]MBP9936428.1 LptF/LptG family permease [Pyrinomonadaceae bacterium]MBK9439345.1 LptF/LptG family permease [Chloracidobacterium sp.]MBK9768677.1 LptF/LptG family permease [Chloracidobacterium sp.]MBL0239368.1 LptF/LptG family permease [Chloracidobacterium sp.]
MKQIGWLISKYLVQAILPYFVFSWLVLSVILFVQQAGRFSDIFFSVNIPVNLIWQLTIALIPNVIAFTCPMAMLVGTIIGLSKMQGDSELTAIRAAGVGNLQVMVPIVILGLLLSLFAFLVNLRGVPMAAALVRSVALQTSIRKLESPIEPGVFNSEVAGYTIYVKDGDLEKGTWKNLFIFQKQPGSGDMRLITSGDGRIDVSGQLSELVLQNATVTTIPSDTVTGKFATENIGEVRLAIRTKRSELIERLSGSDSTPEELGLSELSEYAKNKEGKDRIEAELLWQRRIILSISPLLFCLLGTAMVIRFNRSGRGFGVFLSIVGLVGYYLLAFLGEQLARTGRVSVIAAGILPIAGSVAAIVWLSVSRRVSYLSGWGERSAGFWHSFVRPKEKLQSRNLFVDLTTGLGDFDLLVNLLRYFVVTVVFLLIISAVFTAFELWRFAGVMDGGIWLLMKYLFYLSPFLYLYFAPSAAMVAILATYVIKSRQNEIVTWISAGKSAYRLLVPCFLLMLLVGGLNWVIQERIAPVSNQIQDSIRNQIRKGPLQSAAGGRYWVANGNRIYSFEMTSPATGQSYSVDESPLHVASDNGTGDGGINAKAGKQCLSGPVSDRAASDNVTAGSGSQGQGAGTWLAAAYPGPTTIGSLIFASDNEESDAQCSDRCASDVVVYEFVGDQTKLQTVYHAQKGKYSSGNVRLFGKVERLDIIDGRVTKQDLSEMALAEVQNPFIEIIAKPSHMTSAEISERVKTSDSDVESRSFAVALQKRHSLLLLPFVIALFTAPFSLSLSRKGKVITVGYAVGLWLVYTGVTNVFEQMGMNGVLGPVSAIWSPIVIFSMLGVYLVSKVRT